MQCEKKYYIIVPQTFVEREAVVMKEYAAPKLEVVTFKIADIITTSDAIPTKSIDTYIYHADLGHFAID